MKTLQKQVAILWRFRCERCRSQFEMTDEEKMENDKKFSEVPETSLIYPQNPMHHFDCPVCNTRRYVRNNEMHKIMVMNDGSEIKEY